VGMVLLAAPVFGGPAEAASYITFDVPNCPWTNVEAINAKGEVAGECVANDAGNSYGFVRKADGTIETVDPKSNQTTSVFSINRMDQTTGAYICGPGKTHSFLRSAKGRIDNFVVPEALDTTARGVNEPREIAGFYADANFMTHGF